MNQTQCDFLDKIKNKNIKIYCEKIINQIIPTKTPKELSSYSILCEEDIDIRNFVTSTIGFALVDKKWASKLSNFIGGKKCLEIMCGSGFLSKALKENNIDIIATDNFSWEGHWNDSETYYTNIENIDAIHAIEKYGKNMDYIIMSWAYMDNTAYKCLLKIREINPLCKMIVIGENRGGCTCDDMFFDSIEKLNEFSIEIPSWYGIYDKIYMVK